MIADLHCDLLSYLAYNPKHTALDLQSRCSLPQLEKGGVKLQTLAAYTETKKGSLEEFQKQVKAFMNLPNLYANRCMHFEKENFLENRGISLLFAIENGSGLLEEEEPLDFFFKRFDELLSKVGKVLYISLTWNSENRFGGGALSKKGLSVEGERVLEYLSGRGIAIDLSHTSDALADGILNCIDKKSLSLFPVASHSNFRVISNQERNLPDEIAFEIIKRGGIIGLNFVRLFIGSNGTTDFFRQIDHARALGFLDALCFGADFFYTEHPSSRNSPLIPFYFSEYSDSSCYPKLLEYVSSTLNERERTKLSIENMINFLQRLK